MKRVFSKDQWTADYGGDRTVIADKGELASLNAAVTAALKAPDRVVQLDGEIVNGQFVGNVTVNASIALAKPVTPATAAPTPGTPTQK